MFISENGNAFVTTVPPCPLSVPIIELLHRPSQLKSDDFLGERKLGLDEKPLLVQLNWHKDDREGRFLLRRIDEASQMPQQTQEDSSFKRKLSKREKKALKKQEKQNKIKEKDNKDEGVAEKLYTGRDLKALKAQSNFVLVLFIVGLLIVSAFI